MAERGSREAGLVAFLAVTLLAEQQRWALWLPVAFGAGIALYFSLPVEPPLSIGTGILAALVLLVAIGLRRRAGQGVVVALLAAAAISAGFSAATWRTLAVEAPMLSERLGPTTVTARVVAQEAMPKGSRVVLDRARVSGLRPDLTPALLRLRLQGRQPALWPGDWVRVRAVLTPPPPPSAPGAFDFQRQLFFKGIGATGFSLGTAALVAAAEDASRRISAATWLARLRHDVTARIRAGLEGVEGAVAAALMTGERRAIPEDVTAAMRDAGLAHLLAISGLHLGLVAGILFVGLRSGMALLPALALRYPVKKWAAAAAIAGAFGYGLIAGSTVPTQRAFVAVGLILLAVLLDRRGLSLRSVAWAALIILALQPESLLGASFQMSFAAATALVAGYEALRDRKRVREALTEGPVAFLRRPALYVGGIALTTLIAGLATAPFAAYHFGRVADYGLVGNLVAVPLTALWVMPWAVVAFMLMPFGLESWALAPMGWGISGVIATAREVAAWPGAVTLLPVMPLWGLAAAALGGVWLCLWRRPWRLAGIGGVALAFASIATTEAPHVLVDGEGRLVAARTAAGNMAVNAARRAAFTRDMWLRRAGLSSADGVWPAAGRVGGRSPARKAGERPRKPAQAAPTNPRLTCDISGCFYRAVGRSVAIAYDEAALSEDCWRADVVLSLVPVRRRCPAAVAVVDRFDLWRLGAHGITLAPDGIHINSVNGTRGHRPWVVRRQQVGR